MVYSILFLYKEKKYLIFKGVEDGVIYRND
jgi:hypothetical protein